MTSAKTSRMRGLLPFVGAAFTFCSINALAAGLELTQHGVKEMGHGYAGTATLLEDASAVAHNPAGLLRLGPGMHASVGLSVLHADIDYDVEVRREKIENRYGVPSTAVSGPGGGNSSDTSLIPHLYYSYRINEDAAVGIGIYAPFGSGTEFPDHWAGRYHAIETEQTATNINPVFAFRVNDRLSLGLGAVLQMYEAKLTNKIDVGYLVAEGLLEQVEAQEGAAAARDVATAAVELVGSQFDVHNDIEMDSIAFGLNFGLLWDVSERTRIGLNYRSRTHHIATGDAKRPEIHDAAFRARLQNLVQNFAGLTDEASAEAVASAFDGRGALGGDLESEIIFPDVLTLSAHHDFNDRFAVMGSVSYIAWNVFDELRLEYDDDTLRGGTDLTGTGDDVRRRDLVQPLNFENSYRVGLGARYQLNDRLTLRTGASYDRSPLRDAEFRTPRGPDNDRYMVGFGGSYQFRPNLVVDAAYALIIIDEGETNAAENPAGTLHRAVGHSEGTLNNFGLQVNYQF